MASEAMPTGAIIPPTEKNERRQGSVGLRQTAIGCALTTGNAKPDIGKWLAFWMPPNEAHPRHSRHHRLCCYLGCWWCAVLLRGNAAEIRQRKAKTRLRRAL